jgi:hypothetical protein
LGDGPSLSKRSAIPGPIRSAGSSGTRDSLAFAIWARLHTNKRIPRGNLHIHILLDLRKILLRQGLGWSKLEVLEQPFKCFNLKKDELSR